MMGDESRGINIGSFSLNRKRPLVTSENERSKSDSLGRFLVRELQEEEGIGRKTEELVIPLRKAEPNKSLAIPSESRRSKAKIDEEEYARLFSSRQQRLKRADRPSLLLASKNHVIALADDDLPPTSETYDEVPVSQYGAAMLRGMGVKVSTDGTVDDGPPSVSSARYALPTGPITADGRKAMKRLGLGAEIDPRHIVKNNVNQDNNTTPRASPSTTSKPVLNKFPLLAVGGYCLISTKDIMGGNRMSQLIEEADSKGRVTENLPKLVYREKDISIGLIAQLNGVPGLERMLIWLNRRHLPAEALKSEIPYSNMPNTVVQLSVPKKIVLPIFSNDEDASTALSQALCSSSETKAGSNRVYLLLRNLSHSLTRDAAPLRQFYDSEVRKREEELRNRLKSEQERLETVNAMSGAKAEAIEEASNRLRLPQPTSATSGESIVSSETLNSAESTKAVRRVTLPTEGESPGRSTHEQNKRYESGMDNEKGNSRSNKPFSVERVHPREDGAKNWLHPGCVVRVIDKQWMGGKYYREKVLVLDVIAPGIADVQLLHAPSSSRDSFPTRYEKGRIVSGVPQSKLDTALPKPGGHVKILRGSYQGRLAKLLERDSRAGKAEVKLLDDGVVRRYYYEDIAEYINY